MTSVMYNKETISKVAELNPSKSALKKLSADTQVSFIGMKNVLSDGSFTFGEEGTLADFMKGFTYFQNGDILFAKITPCMENGKGCVVDGLKNGVGFGSTEFHVIRSGENVIPKYLEYLLRSPALRKFAESKMTGSAGQKRVPKSFFDQVKIPLPPLETQKKIAEILDTADAYRQKTKALVAKYDELAQSLFLDMFGDPVTNPKGWERVGLSDRVFFQEGPGVRKWQFRDSGIKLINVKNIVNGHLDLSNTQRHLEKEEALEKYCHFLADEHDLVMATSGVTWGKVAWVKKEHLPLCMNTSVIRFKPIDASIRRFYMRSFLESMSFKSQMNKLITGSAQPNFGPSHLKKVWILVPPISIQIAYEQRLKKMTSMKQIVENQLRLSDDLFNSLLQKAFKGELV